MNRVLPVGRGLVHQQNGCMGQDDDQGQVHESMGQPWPAGCSGSIDFRGFLDHGCTNSHMSL